MRQSFIGLGFDPTENMDSVIQSPSSRPDANAVSQLEGIDFGALGLAPALGGDNISNGNNNHIFAFGSSGTWGSAGDNHDWGAGLLGGHNAKPASASRLFGGLLESTPESDASPSPLDGNHDAFLSLATSGNTWGARTDNSVTPNIIPSLVGGDRSVSSERGVGGD